MKQSLLLLSFILIAITTVSAQTENEPSKAFPYGQPHPDAPEQIKDYEPLMGECDCKSTSRKQDGTWNAPVDMVWRWKYIMNGNAVQDETLKADGANSGSIRQFIADSSKWYVHYYASKKPSTTLSTWTGNKKDGKIVLYKDHTAPNGTPGYYRLSFYDISKTGYKWVGEWVDKTETTVYATWKIECIRPKKQ
jgi:hypothetical protein